jgi:hypothetical protein
MTIIGVSKAHVNIKVASYKKRFGFQYNSNEFPHYEEANYVYKLKVPRLS